MNQKVVIITGGNRGIGKETAKKLAFKGFTVIMACRDLQSAQEACCEISKETNNCNIISKKVDLSSQISIRDFANNINQTVDRLDVLIHNAATVFSKILTNEDGLEMTMATNHFGPFLLTHLLIDLLKKSAPSRIVVVSSALHIFATCKPNNLNIKRTFLPPNSIYVDSKFANICFAIELARRLNGTGVTVNSLHPGMVATDIWNSVPFCQQCIPFAKRLLFKTVEEGARTSVYLACSREVEGITGKYFMDCEQARIWRGADNLNTTITMWKESEDLMLRDGDPRI